MTTTMRNHPLLRTTTLLVLAAVCALVLAACGDPEIPDGPVTGDLSSGDDTLTSGEYTDEFRVRAEPGQFIRAEMTSTAFDPYLIVLGPDEQQSDFPGEGTAVAVVEVEEGGTWEIVATSFAPGDTGDYTITYDVLDQRPADAQ